jgi:2'-5' RNA ligase
MFCSKDDFSRREAQMPAGAPCSDALLFALVPDASAASRLVGIGRDLCVKHGLAGKLLAPLDLHLPLIGSDARVNSAGVDLAMQAAAAINMASFDVVLDRAGSLAGLRRPLVIYGDEGVRGALALQLMLDIATHELGVGIAMLRHPPHVMVLDGWRGIAEEAIEPVRWTATEFVLLRSARGRPGGIVLGRWALGKDRPRGFEEPPVAIGW